jgi:hypothetical protein
MENLYFLLNFAAKSTLKTNIKNKKKDSALLEVPSI